jgi:hypothetical protein
MDCDWEVVYQILKDVIARQDLISYRELTDSYRLRTGKRIHWRNWAPVLDELGDWSRRRGLPTIAAVVINRQLGRPGDRFFGKADARKPTALEKWRKLLERVYDADWPETLEGLVDRNYPKG